MWAEVTLYITPVLRALYDEIPASCPPDMGGRPRRRCTGDLQGDIALIEGLRPIGYVSLFSFSTARKRESRKRVKDMQSNLRAMVTPEHNVEAARAVRDSLSGHKPEVRLHLVGQWESR